MNNYYSRKQYLFAVDKNDLVVGEAEKWAAHKKGLLHRGFTVILFFNDQIALQQRKHPVFDGVSDMSFSSHQVFKNKGGKDDLTDVYAGLKREWNINKDGLIKPPKLLGKIYYRAKDPKSSYIEHEIDYIFSAQLKKLPKPNLRFAYGLTMIKRNHLQSGVYDLRSLNIAPWVKKIVKKIKF